MNRKLYLYFLSLVVVLSLASLGFADDKKVTLTGNIVDKACSAGVAKKDDPQAAAGAHSKGCSLSERCANSGFGVYSDGKYTEFDEKGATLAKDALKKSTKEKGAQFKVTGMIHDGKMMVESISELE
ncbi:MAG: hypothetical protein ABIU20_08690 [Blastocatellia bacterium]